MIQEVQLFSNGQFEVKVREIDGILEFEAECVAKGLGWTQEKKGKLYVRWERMNEFLSSFGYSPRVGKGDYIPESYVYLLGMKAENDIAIAFQKFIAFEVLPKIRKYKVYIDPSATEQEIDSAVRFATPQRRRKALMEATIDGKENIFVVYDKIKEYISNWTASEKISVLEHVERVLVDKQATYGNDVAFVHKVGELLLQVAKDLDKLKNWQNGAKKRELRKENKQLRQLVEELAISV
jgi:prophage antirepressor-like protein